LAAVSAALLLNVALVGTFLWCDWLGAGLNRAAWLLAGVVWATSAGYAAVSDIRRPGERLSGSGSETFETAIHNYLGGNWFETERILAELLRRDQRDAEARLMLATLLRRRGRFDEATDQLDALERLEAAARWHWEIGREHELLQIGRTHAPEPESVEENPNAAAADDPPAEMLQAA
jgi:thioredoxin-like negative regulator of GroEL